MKMLLIAIKILHFPAIYKMMMMMTRTDLCRQRYCEESNDEEGDNADVVEPSLAVGKRNPSLCKLVSITAQARNTNQPVERNTDVSLKEIQISRCGEIQMRPCRKDEEYRCSQFSCPHTRGGALEICT